jgi:hypothetical protein
MSTCVTILTMLSLAACAVAVVIFFVKRARFRRWHRATGRVLEHVLRSTGKPGRLDRKYAPRVSYEVAGGGTCEFISSLATNVPPAVGQQVGVIYDPERPGRAVLDQFAARHRNEFLLFVLGAVGAITFGAEFFSR